MLTPLARLRRFVFPPLLAALLGAGILLSGHKYNASPAAFNSDDLYAVSFCRDLLGSGYPMSGWHLPGAPYLFPDMVLLLPCLWLSSDLAVAFLAYALAFNAALVAVLFWVAREAGLARRDAFLGAAGGVLFLIAVNLGPAYAMDAALLYHPGNHMGAVLVGLLLLALSLRGLRRGYTPLSAAAFVLAGGLGVASDRLLVVQFLIPLALSALLLTRRRLVAGRQAALLIGLIAGAVLLSFATTHALVSQFDFALLRQAYPLRPPTLAGVRQVLASIWTAYREKVLLVAAVALYTAAALAATRRRPEPGGAPEGSGVPGPAVAMLALTTLLTCTCNVTVVLVYALGKGIFADAVPRYLLAWACVPLLCFGLVLRLLPGPRPRLAGRAFPALAALLAVGQVVAHGQGFRWQSFCQPYPPLARAIDDLARRRGSRYGLGGYWEARHVTLLGREGVCVKALSPPGQPFLHGDNPNSFLPPDPQDRTLPRFDFLVFTPGDPMAPDRNALRSEFGEPDEVRVVGPHQIWVYDRLRSRSLDVFLSALLERKVRQGGAVTAPCHPSQLARPKRAFNSPKAGGSVLAQPGSDLEVTFAGPVRGRTLDISLGSSDACEVVFCRGTERLGALKVPRVAWGMDVYSPGPWLVPRLLPLPDEVADRPWDRLLIRPLTPDAVCVGHVLVLAEPVEPLPAPHLRARRRFEAESLWTKADPVTTRVADSRASSGEARRGQPTFAGVLVWGPQLSLDPGRYRAHFALRADGAVGGDLIGRVLVVADGGTRVLACRELRGTDLAQDGSYQEISLDFERDGELDDVELRVCAYGRAAISVDYVDLEPLPPAGHSSPAPR
jgi:hypothetical protein